MDQSEHDAFIVGPDDPVLVTGATGFIGSRLVESLLDRGCRNIRCFARPSSDVAKIEAMATRRRHEGARVEVFRGNLLSREDCAAATAGIAVIFHLAAGTGEKSFPDAFLNTVVTTRNLLEASLEHGCLRRFVNVSSFTVYTNAQTPRRRPLDESCPVEERPALRGDAYCFAKVKQEELVSEYARKFGIRYVTLRLGAVYGPGHEEITSRVGIGTFGVFLHLGGSNQVPLTYVDNCAEAILLAGFKKGVDGEVFNVVDDDLPSSKRVLRLYKQNVRRFTSLYLPHFLSHALCYVWEKYSAWSEEQLPPVFNRRRWRSLWKTTRYSNEKLKARLGWTPKVPMAEGLSRYFQSCRERQRIA